MKKNGFTPILIILVIAILAILGYWFWKNQSQLLGNSRTALSIPSVSPGNYSSKNISGEKFNVRVEVDRLEVINNATGEKFVINKKPTLLPDLKSNRPYGSATNPVLELGRAEDSANTLYGFAWSNDQEKLAIIDAPAYVQEVFVVDMMNKSIKMLTTNSKHPLKEELSWSPDSRKVAFTEFDDTGTGAGYSSFLSVVNIETGTRKDFGDPTTFIKDLGANDKQIATSINDLYWKDNNTLTGTAASVSITKDWELKIPSF